MPSTIDKNAIDRLHYDSLCEEENQLIKRLSEINSNLENCEELSEDYENLIYEKEKIDGRLDDIYEIKTTIQKRLI